MVKCYLWHAQKKRRFRWSKTVIFQVALHKFELSFFVRITAVKTGWSAQCLLLSMCMCFLDLKTDHVSHFPPSVAKYISSRLRNNFEIFSKLPCTSLVALYFADSHYFSDRLVLVWPAHTPLAAYYISSCLVLFLPFCISLNGITSMIDLYSSGYIILLWPSCTPLASSYSSGRLLYL